MKIDFPSLDQFFKLRLRYKQHWNKKVISLTNAHWQKLEQHTYLAGCEYAAGSEFKVFETTNFGWIVFKPETKTPFGGTVNRRIIKY